MLNDRAGKQSDEVHKQDIVCLKQDTWTHSSNYEVL